MIMELLFIIVLLFQCIGGIFGLTYGSLDSLHKESYFKPNYKRPVTWLNPLYIGGYYVGRFFFDEIKTK